MLLSVLACAQRQYWKPLLTGCESVTTRLPERATDRLSWTSQLFSSHAKRTWCHMGLAECADA
jgi:hypothetical protein